MTELDNLVKEIEILKALIIINLRIMNGKLSNQIDVENAVWMFSDNLWKFEEAA